MEVRFWRDLCISSARCSFRSTVKIQDLSPEKFDLQNRRPSLVLNPRPYSSILSPQS